MNTTNNEQIQSYFAFDDSDLLANRNGMLSERQSKRIQAADKFADQFIAGLLTIFLIGAVLMGILALTALTNIGLWVGTGVLILLVLWALRGARTQVDDTVQKAQGEVSFVKAEKQSGSARAATSKRMKVSGYEMCVGGESFANVNPALVEYMQAGTYAVYFTKTTRRILSVEEISQTTPAVVAQEAPGPK